MKKILLPLFVLFTTLICAQTKISNDTLHWSAARPLTWLDFKGEVIEGIGLSGEIFCMNLASFEKKNSFTKADYIVTAVLDRTKTWADKKSRTINGLTYFQIIFDIYEVHARSLRKEFSTTDFGTDPNNVFQEKYNDSMTQLTTEFNQFRKETKLGQNIAELKRWKLKVETELNALDNFK